MPGYPYYVFGDGSETWSDSKHDPIVSNGQIIDGEHYHDLLDQHIAITGDLTCQQMSLPIGHTDGSMPRSDSGCWYTTGNSSIARVKRGGYEVQLAGQQTAGYVDSVESQLFPTSNPDVFIQVVPDMNDPNFYHMYFRSGNALKLTAGNPDWGNDPTLNYMFANPPTKELDAWDGQPLLVGDNLIYSQINYSDNGEWMSIWDGDGRVTRVNLRNFVTTTAYVESSADGAGDFAVTSMSPSGRYMAVNISGKPLRIIDFDKCNPVQFDGKTEQFCDTRFLAAAISHFIGSGSGLGELPNFMSDDLLSYYISQSDGTYYQYFVRAPNTWRTNYIALGDSYASGEGEGNSNFYPETDIHNVNMCHLARNSYPFLLGSDLHLNSTHSVACSGAKVLNILGNGIFDRNLKNPLRTNQYTDHVPNNSLEAWLPGYHEQNRFVQDTSPSILTVSIGGNDIGFAHVLTDCLGLGTCYSSYEDRVELANLINQQFDSLVNLYTTLKQSTSPDAHIYVIGYPSIIKTGGDCGANVHLNHDETVFANDLESYLDSIIKLAAKKAGVFYVDTTTVFAGHRLCESDSSSVNGITVGHDAGITVGPVTSPRILSKGAFHPTVFGHQLLAQRIKYATDNFTASMPRADDSIAGPILDDSLALLRAPKQGRATNEIVYDDTAGQVVYRGIGTTLEYNSDNSLSARLLPNTAVHAVLHSASIDLGTFTTDTDGNININVTIPKSVPPDFHDIDLYVMGLDGKMRDIRRVVYVAASPTDFDGDGIPNSQEPCLVFKVPNGQLHGMNYDCKIPPEHNSAGTGAGQPEKGTSKIVYRSVSAGNSLTSAVDEQTVSIQQVTQPTKTSNGFTSQNNPSKEGQGLRVVILWIIGILFGFVMLTFLWRLRYARANHD